MVDAPIDRILRKPALADGVLPLAEILPSVDSLPDSLPLPGEPGAIDGELIASRARKSPALAARTVVPPTRRYDPPTDQHDDPFAWRGDIRRGDPVTTGAIATRRSGRGAEDDRDWVEEPGPRPAIDWSSDRHKTH